MDFPDNVYYTEEHEWVRVDGKTAVVGITDYAQSELGDIVFVELPAVGNKVRAGEECGTIEAVKTVAQLFAPVSGEVVAVNGELEGDASIINRQPFADGWMIKIEMSDPGEVDSLLSAAVYREKVA